MGWSGNPIADWERYDRQQTRAERRQPRCDKCGFPIWEDGHQCEDGRFICEECQFEEENWDLICEVAKRYPIPRLVKE